MSECRETLSPTTPEIVLVNHTMDRQGDVFVLFLSFAYAL